MNSSRLIPQQNTAYDLFNSMLNQFMHSTYDDSVSSTAIWSPSVDIREENNKYIVLADLPGVNEKDLQVTLENNVLTIKGVRLLDKTVENKGFSRQERFFGQFYRRFTLPESADSSKIQAVCKHGVLELSIPKKAATQAKKINVKHSN